MEELSFLIYGISAAIVFALFDYFGFNISLNKKWADFSLFNRYRAAQLVFQIVLSLLVFLLSGWKAALVFNLIWWTWGCDFLFYLFCEIFNYGNDRGNFKKEVKGNNVQWAWWTPYGLMFTKKGDVIKISVLIIQSIVGVVLAIVIYFL